MKRSLKYRLKANKQTIQQAEYWLDLCRWLYNAALEQRISIYRQNKGSISCFSQIKQLPDLKKAFPEYKEVGSQVLQGVIERLDRAYQGFFRRVKNGNGRAGFPRFKGKNRYDSFTLKQTGWKLEGKSLTISKLGAFRLCLSRPIEGDIKTVTIRRSPTGKWYVSFSCDNVPARDYPEATKEVGIDVGLKSFCVDSNGKQVHNPRYLRLSERLLRVRQRTLSRRVKGSTRRKKARLEVAKCHEKVNNQRKDFLHKLSHEYIKENKTIYIEDLNIGGMSKNKRLSKSINDASWGMFFNFLTYKAEEAGRLVIKVPAHNTSQICSCCGEKVPKTLAVRIHSCPYCGLIADRDLNASRNILAVGQTAQALTRELSCVA